MFCFAVGRWPLRADAIDGMDGWIPLDSIEMPYNTIYQIVLSGLKYQMQQCGS